MSASVRMRMLVSTCVCMRICLWFLRALVCLFVYTFAFVLGSRKEMIQNKPQADVFPLTHSNCSHVVYMTLSTVIKPEIVTFDSIHWNIHLCT